MKPSLLVAILSAILAGASPASHHVVHETRIEHSSWTKLGKPPTEHVLRMRIGLQQSNLDKGPEWLDQVSNPASDKYGQHFTPEEVIDAFRPSDETIHGVKGWLTDSGIDDHQVHLGLHWITFNATVNKVEQLLKADYSVFRHDSGALQVACESYSLPKHVAPKIDLIMPTVHLHDWKQSKPVTKQETISSRALERRVPEGWKETLKRCNETMVPSCLRSLYSLPVGSTKHPKNSFGVLANYPLSYNPSDLDLFFKITGSAQVGNRPTLKSIGGGAVLSNPKKNETSLEANLDLEYAMALIYPQKVTLFQVGQTGDLFNDFLDGIDASYCMFAGGAAGGFQGPRDCGKYRPTKVFSSSLALVEASSAPFYTYRQCYEYMKLGMMGVSVLFSSGDSGVGGGDCNSKTGTTFSSARFRPQFPATCPYVTTVGATQIKDDTSLLAALSQNENPEQAAYSFSGGGGFSKQFAMPDYQVNSVKKYLAKHVQGYDAKERAGFMKARGFPDISANGVNYQVADNGQFSKVLGTSASSPVLGAMLTLINEQRLYHGKSTIGFINPVIYAHPEIVNDVGHGDNHDCDLAGFQAAKGWDPVTGLGTPSFSKMQDLFLQLP